LESDRTTTEDTAALPNGNPSCDVEVVPKPLDARMCSAPLLLKLLDFPITETARLKFSPRPESAHISKREIADFSDVTFRRFFREGAVRHAEDSASCGAVNFVARVVRCIVSAIAIKLPRFAGDPRQHARFDCGKIRAN
jgi:hypothetical protein